MKPGRVTLDDEGSDASHAKRGIDRGIGDEQISDGCVRHERLGSVQNVVVAVSQRPRTHAENVRTGIWFGGCIRTDERAVTERREILAPLLLGTVHYVSVWCSSTDAH